MPIYLPKEIVPINPTVDTPLFYLAGPVRGGGDWQADMARIILKRIPDAHIAIPTRWDTDHQLSEHFYQPFADAGNRQVAWERHYMKQAGIEFMSVGCVIFWLPLENETDPHPGPEPYAMDTRRELGKFTAYTESFDVRMVIGGHRDFLGLSTILDELEESVWETYLFYESMEAVVDNACISARK